MERLVADAQLHKIAAAKLAIDAQVEQCKIAGARLYLKPDANRPDILDLQGRLLPDEISLISLRKYGSSLVQKQSPTRPQ